MLPLTPEHQFALLRDQFWQWHAASYAGFDVWLHRFARQLLSSNFQGNIASKHLIGMRNNHLQVHQDGQVSSAF